jgi:hypothetical protein
MKAMKNLTAVLLVVLPIAAAAAESGKQAFGKPLEGLEPTSLAALLDKPRDGARVRLEGTIEKVCERKGCWLALKQGERSIHVTFEGYSFFVPKDAAGRPVALEGRVIVKQPTEAEAAHLESEGAGKAARSAVSIEATGVEIAGPTP